ncbi:MAG: 4-hydroxythreonine-4-phosphate dehydrogenase [Methylobacteriaceae bacterium]|nr:4-hydroxythreonine-4-phosphate dehydrogenase [Methylobacteriaceae bacterium]
MAPDFIFMLTRRDRTIADAHARLKDVFAEGVKHVGFKDVGLPIAELRRIADAVHAAGLALYLEVVSLDAASEVASAEIALQLGAHVLMGGTHPQAVLPVVRGTPIRYYPFAGRVSGHPSVLHGTIDEIVESARRLVETEGVHGLDLLAYRFAGDAPALIAQVCRAVSKPVVVAGSIDRAARLASVASGGAAAFTVGTAVLDGVFPTGQGLRDQLAFVVAAVSSMGQL